MAVLHLEPRFCLVLQELWLLVSVVTLNDIIYRLNDDIISHLNILLILFSVIWLYLLV